ncbi:MAG: hypothetical protein QNJ90_06940 [Planctomycetota bacterium]|nr:hypothetical protein [Planctomycetota bacterium]
MCACVDRVLLAVLLAFTLSACATPSRQPPPQPAGEEAPPASPAPPTAPVKPQSTPAEPQVETPAAAAPTSKREPFDAARAGLVVTNPRRWRVKRRDLALVYEGSMRVPSVVLVEPRASTLQAAVDGLADELSVPLGRVRITKPAQPTTLAGYPAYVAEGTGTAEGFPMRWRATVVDARRLTLVLALAPSFFWGGNVRAIRSFEQGIRKTDVETAAPTRGRVSPR